MKPECFIIRKEYFDHVSWLHGIGHTGRVMALVWELCHLTGLESQKPAAYCAAFIHDMSRQHDGICKLHGSLAAKMKLPQFRDFFLAQGLSETELKAVGNAVHWHSLTEEADMNHEHYQVISLLKDADALDRIRLGPHDLDARFLRFTESHQLIKPARKLFMKSALKQEKRAVFYHELLGKILKSFK